ncbi:MAG TPA: hypothetical protein VGF60_08915 [Xanthobacteraceae bacterium]|jgi:hypothetical protein
MLHKEVNLCNKPEAVMAGRKGARRRPVVVASNLRRSAVLATVERAGLLAGARARIAGRIRKRLVKAAKSRSGIDSDTDLLEYALARVALEDDFARKLIAREGRVPQDIDLEF